MNFKEEQILEYLDKLQLQITDPTQKQQDYYESKKHKINQEHKHFDSDPSSPFSLREILSPISLFHTYSIQTCDINNTNNNNHHHNHHHNQQIHHAHNLFRLHLNTHSLVEKKVEF
ncbi:unnamed protein product [Paramecium sonneborni]|uniref:Uncharacterized protein n=1 Tax=Paramecium sonneborni TaxID=65129 RepID=A0A8S1MJ90_9CILI|nr:unnamed protein product [Paramecium sonneborni]